MGSGGPRGSSLATGGERSALGDVGNVSCSLGCPDEPAGTTSSSPPTSRSTQLDAAAPPAYSTSSTNCRFDCPTRSTFRSVRPCASMPGLPTRRSSSPSFCRSSARPSAAPGSSRWSMPARSSTRRQAALYQQAVKELTEQLDGAKGIKRKGLVLAFLMRFKQICNHPSQWLGDGARAVVLCCSARSHPRWARTWAR